MRNMWTIVGIVILVLLVLLLLGGVGMLGLGGFGMMRGYGMMGPGMMYGWGGLGWLLMVLFWALVIGGGIWLIVMLTRRGAVTTTLGPGGTGQTPLDILQMRYARGEITREQFEQMKRDLGLSTETGSLER